MNAAPGLNSTVLRAGSFMGVPARMFLATRGFRLRLWKLPNPARTTRSPLATASLISPTRVSMTSATDVLDIPVRLAISETRELLFTARAP